MQTSLRLAFARLVPALALVLAPSLAHAQSPRTSSRTSPTVGTLITLGAPSTPAERGGGTTLSQSTSEAITGALGCPGPADASSRSSVYRVFDLAALDVTDPFRPVSFRTGISPTLAAETQVSLRIHTLTDPSAPISLGNLSTVDAFGGPISPDAAGTVLELGLGDEVPAIAPTAKLVVEFATLGEDASTIVAGVNGDGESAPTYTYSSNCGDTNILEASTVAVESDWVMSITGVAETGGPENDDFLSTPTGFIIEPGTTTGSNVGATLEPTEVPSSCQASDGASVWWLFTAPADGVVSFDLGASDFDTVVALYPDTFGESRLPTADEEIACNDDANGTLQSLVTDVPVTGGVFYALRVSGYITGGVQREGNISFDFAFAPTVAREATPDGEVTLTAAPNPVRDATTVTLSVPTAQTMTVAVFDALGRQVATLHDGAVAAGALPLSLDASALPSGVYVVRAVGETVRLSERVTVVR